uniref:Methyltransferase domain-containing protein n=2 Tax=cellular organisms TaxID=131567 RepID=A0A7J3TFU4_9EURY
MNVKEEIKKYWNRRSKFYDLAIGHGISGKDEEEAWLAELRNVFGEHRKKILDVGTGTGFLAFLLARLGYEVTGVDISNGMLDIARKKAQKLGLNVQFVYGDAENLPFDEQTFDGVICRHLLWTLPNPERAISEWIRVTVQRGKIVIIEGAWDKRGILAKFIHRIGWMLHKIVRERSNPLKEYPYRKNVKDKLPYAKGLTGAEIVSLLSKFELEEISVKDLRYLREIQKKYVPWYLRISYTYPYFLVSGTVSEKSKLRIKDSGKSFLR